jgi:beta-phosphoglucomutase-like phosphatase (HAD superfamily)
MAIATSASSERTLGTLDRFGITSKFSSIVTGSDVGKGKPDPSVYRLVAERLGTAPEDLLVFEDAVSGVRAAKSAGMKCFAVATNGRADLLLDAGADYVIPNFSGLTLAAVEELWTKTQDKNAAELGKLIAK